MTSYPQQWPHYDIARNYDHPEIYPITLLQAGQPQSSHVNNWRTATCQWGSDEFMNFRILWFQVSETTRTRLRMRFSRITSATCFLADSAGVSLREAGFLWKFREPPISLLLSFFHHKNYNSENTNFHFWVLKPHGNDKFHHLYRLFLQFQRISRGYLRQVLAVPLFEPFE